MGGQTEPSYLELLTCTICYTYMNNYVKLCILGHSVCNDCCINMKTCPYCRSPFSKTRNRNLEQLLSAFPPQNPSSSELIKNENLKCPKCRTLMDDRIVLCGGGHSICIKCVRGLHQCVLCPKLICYRRNFLLERLIEKLKAPRNPNGLAQLQVKCTYTEIP
ncbi:E3 ubiquitin-protein ligase Siah2-like isoform X2 [Harmonia axyridis]|uniref:E3 ubiquitin-protein ligase Siah2-like isoform X2 n=1 Tax=Harmonia axyridis TaxID=115357 RepID=UPI001E275A40|nr:E3 ubiquitin-protein ligase Siah2-like isoform X2 [Harmonia axyridis]